MWGPETTQNNPHTRRSRIQHKIFLGLAQPVLHIADLASCDQFGPVSQKVFNNSSTQRPVILGQTKFIQMHAICQKILLPVFHETVVMVELNSACVPRTGCINSLFQRSIVWYNTVIKVNWAVIPAVRQSAENYHLFDMIKGYQYTRSNQYSLYKTCNGVTRQQIIRPNIKEDNMTHAANQMCFLFQVAVVIPPCPTREIKRPSWHSPKLWVSFRFINNCNLRTKLCP